MGYVFNNTPKTPIQKKGITFSDVRETHTLVTKEILERAFSNCHFTIGVKLFPDLFFARL